MVEILSVSNLDTKIVKTITEMKPLEVGRIISKNSYKDAIVMRTASSEKFEVMNLSEPGLDACWITDSDYEVELLPEKHQVSLAIFNEF